MLKTYSVAILAGYAVYWFGHEAWYQPFFYAISLTIAWYAAESHIERRQRPYVWADHIFNHRCPQCQTPIVEVTSSEDKLIRRKRVRCRNEHEHTITQTPTGFQIDFV